jgi:hypothetical protein
VCRVPLATNPSGLSQTYMIYARHTCKPHSCIVFAAAAPECLLLWVLVEQASACWPVNGALLKLEAPASLMAEAQFVAPVFRCMLVGQCAGGLHCHVHLLGIGIVRIYGAGQSRTRAGNGSRSTLFVTHTRLGASQGRTVLDRLSGCYRIQLPSFIQWGLGRYCSPQPSTAVLGALLSAGASCWFWCLGRTLTMPMLGADRLPWMAKARNGSSV